MVGDRERIESDLADALMSRLHSAGLELHQGLALALAAEAQGHIEAAIDEIDAAIRLIRIAAIGLEPPHEGVPPS